MKLEKYGNLSGPSLTFWRRIFPFLRWWNFVGWDTVRADAMAGLTGAVIVLPQGVAFAMIAGLPPEYGLYTAIVVPLVAALFGSSLHLISGPTTAISIVVFSSLSPIAVPGSPEFISLAITLTFLAGVFQLALGLARMGILVNFVSHSVIVGFTAGAAILIATSQIGHVLGIHMPKSASFFATWMTILQEFAKANPYAVIVAGGALVCAAGFKMFRPRWPGLLFALIFGSLIGVFLGAESHGIRLMEPLPDQLPPFLLPDFSFDALHELAPKSFAVALIGLIEALSIARSIAAFSRQQIDGSQEFIGQGLSNIVGSFFSCYAGSGSFTRSGINYHAGAMTPLSAVFSAVFLAFILLLVAPLTEYLPIPAMAGVILLVAFNLIDFHHIRTIIRTSKQEAIILAATFLATLFLDLEFAIYAGVLLSLIFYLRQTAHPEIVSLMPDPEGAAGNFCAPSEKQCPALKIIRIDGSLFFGAVNHISEFFQTIDKKLTHKSHLLIVAYGINFIDITGAEMLVNESVRRRGMRGDLYLCGLKPHAREVLERGGYMDSIGKDHIFVSETEAIANILEKIDNPECRKCRAPVFSECKK
ncbi:MAG: SulP family inorganic anion transporter [Desulfobacteraceae bacterium]|nr:MAG: SulP family inorganic anion transporter [Desulfobacteraceae bacterium]